MVLLDDLSCELRRLVLRRDHVVHVVILVLPMQMIHMIVLPPVILGFLEIKVIGAFIREAELALLFVIFVHI